MTSFTVRRPVFTLTYENTDITADIAPFVESITYTDKVDGEESDEVEIIFDNSRGIWLDEWLPSQGDTLKLTLGYSGEPQLEAEFQVDTLTFNGGDKDTFTVKGLATPTDKPLRQQNTTAFENTTLEEIAQKVADKHGLELVGKVKPIAIERVTQKDQTDLAFLKDQAKKYGMTFKVVDGKKLVFYDEKELQNADEIYVIDKLQLKSYSFSEGQQDTFSGSEVSYQNPQSGELISHSTKAEDTRQTKADTLKVNAQVENEQQAIAQSEEQLRQQNQGQVKGTIEFEGLPQLSAGVNIKITGFGKYAGKFQIRLHRHDYTKRGGYTGTAEVIRTEPVERE